MSAATVATVLLASTPALVDAGVKLYQTFKKPDAPRSTKGEPRTATSSALPSFNASQLQAMRDIAQEVKRASLPSELARSRPALTLGLWVNAWFESRLNPNAYNGKNEDSVGLFQINRRAHPGHSTASLKDAGYNTRVMLGIITNQASKYNDILRRGASVHTLAAAITLWAERPKDPKKKAVLRANELATWFPQYAYLAALAWKP